MAELSVTATSTRAWLAGGYQTELQGTVRGELFPVRQLAAGVLADLDFLAPACTLQSATGATREIVNLRGKPLPGYSGAESKEELLYLSGSILSQESEDIEEDADESDLPMHPFTFSVCTRYAALRSAKEIAHNCLVEASFSADRGPSSVDTLLTDSSVSVDEFRLGIEYYQPRFVGSVFGLAPRIEGWSYIMIRPGEVQFLFHDDRSRTVAGMPFSSSGVIAALSATLETSEIFDNFQTALQQAVADQET